MLIHYLTSLWEMMVQSSLSNQRQRDLHLRDNRTNRLQQQDLHWRGVLTRCTMTLDNLKGERNSDWLDRWYHNNPLGRNCTEYHYRMEKYIPAYIPEFPEPTAVRHLFLSHPHCTVANLPVVEDHLVHNPVVVDPNLVQSAANLLDH